ncbi:PREDICTED: PH and SEC7 domain-containing protein 4-like, partial [Calidris pugnax]|uniref:PH and SEC7 domain-containing protein 4-like n=1 Tax=Calidris pugnax TaxID=198806 RepID=UPI00071C1F49
MFSWISRLNLVAALFSSPPFPAAVGSQRRFVRPILPAAPSRSPPEEQQRSHEVWLERVAQELLEHQRNLPEKKGRARDLEEYRLKKEYLLYEVGRLVSLIRGDRARGGPRGGWVISILVFLHGRDAVMGPEGHEGHPHGGGSSPSLSSSMAEMLLWGTPGTQGHPHGGGSSPSLSPSLSVSKDTAAGHRGHQGHRDTLM